MEEKEFQAPTEGIQPLYNFNNQNLQIEMLSIEQFAAKMGVGRTTVFSWLKTGNLLPGRHFIRIGKTIRFAWGPELFHRLQEDSLGPIPAQKDSIT